MRSSGCSGPVARSSMNPRRSVWHLHRASFIELRRHLYGYGMGLSAYITKYLADPATRGQLLRQVPSGVIHMLGLWGRADAEGGATRRSYSPRHVGWRPGLSPIGGRAAPGGGTRDARSSRDNGGSRRSAMASPDRSGSAAPLGARHVGDRPGSREAGRCQPVRPPAGIAPDIFRTGSCSSSSPSASSWLAESSQVHGWPSTS